MGQVHAARAVGGCRRCAVAAAIRSSMALTVRHKITQNLIPSEGATLVKTPAEAVTERCPVRGMVLAGAWFDIYPTHVYVQQAARLAPHSANNWHRLGLLYLVVEGLMTDLFLLIAYDGYGAKIQYISLGYNIADLLSMLFEIVENTTLLRSSALLLIKRVLFNSELTLWGELLFSIAFQSYFSALNESDLGPTRKVAEAISFYAWGLINHAVIVFGQTAFILTMRIVGTVVMVLYRFGSLRIIVTPCCVDSIMGSRYKLAMSGYVFHYSRLDYTQWALKAHGLLTVVDAEGKKYLVYHKIHWLPSGREDLEIVGKLTGEHVDPCPETLYTGPVTVCDRKLGEGTDDDVSEMSNEVEDLESAELMACGEWRLGGGGLSNSSIR